MRASFIATESFADAVRAEFAGTVLEIEIDLPGALAIVSLLQLALRHPSMADYPYAAGRGREFIDVIISVVAGENEEVAVVMRKGDDPQYDGRLVRKPIRKVRDR